MGCKGCRLDPTKLPHASMARVIHQYLKIQIKVDLFLAYCEFDHLSILIDALIPKPHLGKKMIQSLPQVLRRFLCWD